MTAAALDETVHRPLRVCMVHYSDYHLDSRVQRQARALAERGDELDVICLSDPATLRVGDGVVRLHRVRCEKSSGGAGAYLRGYARFFAGALARVSRLDRSRRFHVVEAHNMPDVLSLCALGPKLRGAGVVLNVHDTFPELFATKFGVAGRHPLVRLLEHEERFSARLADRIVTVTGQARERLNGRGVGLGRTAVVMNSPDERVFGPPRSPVAIPAAGEVRLIYHGGSAPRFGVEELIRAVGMLEDRVSLRVCATGENRAGLAALAADVAPGRVDVAPEPIPFQRIPDELARAHIGVVPTVRDPFTELLLPVKLLEYVHMGLPAVASRLPGIERYLGDGELRFCEPGSPESLAEAIADAIAEPDAACARAERASRRLTTFAWKAQRQEYLELIDRLASASRHREEGGWKPIR